MKTGPLNKDTFAERYPEKKPVCLNYATVREDMLALIEENESLNTQLRVSTKALLRFYKNK